MDPETYRKLQIDAVTGHSGTSELQVQLITSLIHASLWILSSAPIIKHQHIFGWTRFFSEFILIIIPQISLLVFPEYLQNISMALGLTALLFSSSILLFGSSIPRISQPEYFSQIRLPFITNFRASIMILTMLCILGVDFATFPRSWAKTETWGTSVMDVGVGCIIFSSGLVSSVQFRTGSSPPFKASIRSSLSMLIMGLLRMAMVKFFGYQEHVSEYGIHWNFFMTLAVPPILSNLLSRLVSIRKFISASLIISFLYEVALKFVPLEPFILDGIRTNLFTMNKEGIFSLFGCLSLFMLSCGVGTIIQNTKEAKVKNRFKLLLLKLLGLLIVNWVLYFVVKWIGLVPSRRLMNFPFILWTSAVSLTHITLLFIMDMCYPNVQNQSILMTSVNDNQLLIFLLANLGTGLVNMLFQTLLVSRAVSFGILTFYSLVLCLTAFWLKKLSLRFRLK